VDVGDKSYDLEITVGLGPLLVLIEPISALYGQLAGGYN